jgi:putative DNA methylase
MEKREESPVPSLLTPHSSLLIPHSSLLTAPDWLITQTLIHTLDTQGETGAAELLATLADKGDIARDLAYRLYSLCDKKGWNQESIAYNSLVIARPGINRLASQVRQSQSIQTILLSR